MFFVFCFLFNVSAFKVDAVLAGQQVNIMMGGTKLSDLFLKNRVVFPVVVNQPFVFMASSDDLDGSLGKSEDEYNSAISKMSSEIRKKFFKEIYKRRDSNRGKFNFLYWTYLGISSLVFAAGSAIFLKYGVEYDSGIELIIPPVGIILSSVVCSLVIDTSLYRLEDDIAKDVTLISNIKVGDVLDNLVYMYLLIKTYIPQETQTYIEGMIVELAHLHLSNTDNPIYRKLLSNCFVMVNAAFKLAETLAKSKIKRYINNVASLKNGLPTYPKSTVDRLIDGIAMQLNTGSSRKSFLLTGDPGTGKTFLVKQLGKILNLPVIYVPCEGKTAKDLLGNDPRSYDKDVAIGEIILAILSASSGDNDGAAIIVFDEILKTAKINQQVWTFLHTLTEPNTKTLRSDALGAEIPLDKIIFILIDNSSVQLQSMKERLNIIEFKGYSIDEKKKIFFNTIIPRYEEMFGVKISNNQTFVRIIYSLIDASQKASGFREIERQVALLICEAKLKLNYGIKLSDFTHYKVELMRQIALSNTTQVAHGRQTAAVPNKDAATKH